ncbi:MAG: hypothetical protein WCE46_10655 [Methanoregula sp.]|jgi:hypothetical protein|uniref:hypothetical protein n=1 Tax=Methanoregula sp. TaxID=2052170 RepID=UPI003C734593
MSAQATPPSASHDTPLSVISGFFGGFLGVAAALALALLLLPSKQYVSLSNYLQILAAFAGAAVFCYCYLRHEGGPGLLWAAGAFALWGIVNVAWYAAVFFGAGTFSFPSLIDMGFVAAILLLSSAYNRLYPRKQVGGPVLLALLFLMLVVPLAILATGGITDKTLMILLYFFACGSLIITALNHSFTEHPAALAGTILFAISFMIYPIRETFFAGNAVLAILGPCVAAGFSLIVLGLIQKGKGTHQPAPEQPAAAPRDL